MGKESCLNTNAKVLFRVFKRGKNTYKIEESILTLNTFRLVPNIFNAAAFRNKQKCISIFSQRNAVTVQLTPNVKYKYMPYYVQVSPDSKQTDLLYWTE